MGLFTLLMFLNIAIFTVAVSLIVFVYPVRRWPLARWLIVFVGSLCLISFFSLSVYSQESFEIKVMFSRLRFLGLAILAPSWLLFLSTSFQAWTWLQRRGVVAVLFFPALITIACTLSPALQSHVIHSFTAIQVLGLSVLSYEGGSWFPVHYLWSVALMLVSFVLGARILMRGTSVQRRHLLFLMSGSCLSLAVDSYCVATNSPLRWAMLPAGTYLITEAALAYGVFRYRLLASALIDMEKVYLHLPDPVVVVDEWGKLAGYNHAAKNAFFFSSASVGRTLQELIPSLPTQKQEFEFVNLAGVSRFFEFSFRTIGAGQDYHGQVIFFRDVTDHKENAKRLSENMEFRSRLMALIAHDMFGHVQNQARLSEVLRDGVPLESKELADLLSTSTQASRDFMGNILSWAKTQEQAFQLVRKPFEINVLLEEIIEELAGLFKAQKVTTSFQSHRRPLIVSGDSQMVGTAARNLLTNALRASSAGKSVQVTVSVHDQEVSVTVQDHGVGMTREEVDNLLSKQNKKVFGAKSHNQGFGVGFSLVRQFVDLHNGSISVDSVLGRGTEVRFTIPL
ncbi:MAG: hypothetical protein HUU57_12060 [Bdellovibrio sp.]|nr:hypothetical protein [Bdellovibrio sp.]